MTTQAVEARPDTIVPQPGNVEVASPEVLTAAEAAPAEAVETAKVEPAPEVKAPPRGITDLSDEEFDAEPRVKDRLRRQEQSVRDRTQAEVNRRLAQERQQYVARSEYAEEIAAAYSVDEQGAVSVDRRKLGDVVGKLQAALADQTNGQVYAALNAITPYESLPAETRARIAAAADWLPQYLDAIADVRAESRLPDLKKGWEADYRKQQEARTVVQQREAASAARQVAPSATPGIVGGGAKPAFASIADADAAYLDGTITLAEFKQERERFGLSEEPGR